ncbi:SulP family inorganic anion transporter [Pseudoclavibacter sp. 13-3]|uniref:SulP family inorganic anion transporter n=1 Tax=Pseudoclavibacter sp. 13-3 TaxID=2901228 RepID=UPI001E32C1CA|nr:SulP family inorganic anion transporter [Pseudoclavibacter sp. 13-3]MCD7101738.1 STAS domain-containing protein [Pseudoclavibacter sp. 13-3]
MNPRLARWLPGLQTAGRYRLPWLRHDLLAGATLTALLIPAGMGYAQVAGLPPVTGLYASIVPLLVYAVVGPSRILVLGPDSSLAPMIAAAIVPLSAGSPQRVVALAGLLAIIIGALMLLGGLMRLGFLADFLSKPIRIGYLNGIVIVIMLSQLPNLLGVDDPSGSPLSALPATLANLRAGHIAWAALTIGLVSTAAMILLRLIAKTIPSAFLVIGLATAAVAALGLQPAVDVVGALPFGLPHPTLIGLLPSDLVELAVPAMGIALIAFADTSILSRTFAARTGSHVSSNREMIAVGVANVSTGLCGGFPVSGSSSRTPVVQSVGGRTQLSSVAGALLLIVFILLAPGVTAYLPEAALAAVVIAATATMFSARDVLRLVRRSPIEALLSLATTASVIAFGVLEGVAIAVGLSLLAFINQTRRPYRTELGLVPGMRGYHDLTRHPEGRRLPGIAIARFDAPLMFANSGSFTAFVQELADRPRDPPVHTLILASEPVTRVDITAADAIAALDDELTQQGVRLILAEARGPMKDQLIRFGAGERFEETGRFAPTVGAAVDAITGSLRTDIAEEPEAGSDQETGPTQHPPK